MMNANTQGKCQNTGSGQNESAVSALRYHHPSKSLLMMAYSTTVLGM